MTAAPLKILGLCTFAIMYPGSGDAEGDAITFSGSILPILEARCASCHMTGDEPGGMALISDMAYASLIRKSAQVDDMLIVKPGFPLKSYLILKLEGRHLQASGQGARMPLAAPALPEKQLKLFRAWIEQGALEN